MVLIVVARGDHPEGITQARPGKGRRSNGFDWASRWNLCPYAVVDGNS